MSMRSNGARQPEETKAIMGKKARRSGKPRKGLGLGALSAAPPPVVDPFREAPAPQLAGEIASQSEGENESESQSENAGSEHETETAAQDAEEAHGASLAPDAAGSVPPEPPVDTASVEASRGSEALPAVRAEAVEADGADEADEADETSVPPVSDWDSAFFSDPFAEDEPDPRAERYAIFAASADRRAHLARYVVGAVGFSSALCLAALLKVALIGSGGSASAAVTGAAAATLQNVPAEVSVAVPDESSASVSPGAPVEPSANAPAPANAPPVESASAQGRAEAPAAPSASVVAPVELPGKAREREAMRQREASRSALERNGFTAAVEAGERAVALDPTDGESWLILGAAYQARGDAANARRCYRTCLAEAKRGPRSECAGMLR